jgi:hypothetical protein
MSSLYGMHPVVCQYTCIVVFDGDKAQYMIYEFCLEFHVFFEGQEVECGKVLSTMAPICKKSEYTFRSDMHIKLACHCYFTGIGICIEGC